jgi:phage/plasmid-like protein (TIGR03299 family)
MICTEGLESYRAVVRSDNGKALGIVGKDYAMVQNDEIFDFLTSLAEFDLDVKMVAGGAMGKGEIVWALARVPSLAMDFKGDKVDTMLMLSNGHAGNATLKVDAYTLRKICQNGMHALTVDKSGLTIGKGWNLKHTTGINDRFEQAQGVLSKLAKDHAATLEAFEALAGIPATFQTVEAIAEKVYGKTPEEKGKKRTIATNRLDDLRTIWNSPTNKGLATQDTLWTAVNALTEWMEHESITRDGNYTQEESRIKGNYLEGTAAGFKESAYSYALTMAGL